MTDENKSLAQQYHEAVEALKAAGTSNADAVRQVAEQFGKEVNAVRGGIHQYKTRHLGGGTSGTATRSRRKAEASVDDFLASARKAVEEALALVEREPERIKTSIEALKVELASTEAAYDQAVAAARDKKTELTKKLKALD